MTIEPYLNDLERRIDPAVEEQLLADWRSFHDGTVTRESFSPRRLRPAPAALPWPRVTVNQALDSPEKMVLQQLAGCSAALAAGSGAIMNVRANYGTGILPSLFGAAIFRMEDELDTLPTSIPLADGSDGIRRLLDAGPPALTAGYGAACFALAERLAALFTPYPRIAKYVHIYHPDLQGPMDVCELLWGSNLFVDLIDVPDLAHALLALITDTYLRFMRQWEAVIPPRGGGLSAHWGLLHRGRIMLRDDSAMNLSPAMFDSFIRPYDQRLLTELGGGAVHFCGRGDHYIDRLARMSGVHGVALSQPECNDMERIFRHTVDKGIVLLALPAAAANAASARGRPLRGRVHVWQ